MKKNLLFFALLLSALLSIFNCKDLEDEVTNQNETSQGETNQGETNKGGTNQNGNEKTVSKIPKEYWGHWIQMDSGDDIYIDSESINKYFLYEEGMSFYGGYWKEVATSIDGYSLDGENILKKGSTVYFRKGGSARSFSATVSGFSDSMAARALSTGKQGISGRRQNTNNAEDSQTATSDENGKISFTGAVADDTQEITVENSSVEITPNYDGENVGTIPIVESGTYGFKTTYSIESDIYNPGFCYGNNYQTYSLKLYINNIGSEMCETSLYSISCPDSKLSFGTSDLTGNFSSISAGSAKTLSFSVKYGELNSEYVDVPINISITDSKYLRTWEDSVTIRFYKGFVRLKVNARNFDSSSSATLKGFLIYPDGRSKRFVVSAGSRHFVLVPWSEKDYHLAFSGATTSNEIAYSFGFADKTTLADLSGIWSISDINAYESNDSISTAYSVTDLTNPVKAYLKAGDIDFYTINCSSANCSTHMIGSISYETKEYENGNGDGLVTPGESLYLDVNVRNIAGSDISGVSVKLSTTNSYVTIVQDSYTIGDMMKSGSNYYITYKASFKFSVASDCPRGTTIPFTLTFTDSSGLKCIECFNVAIP